MATPLRVVLLNDEEGALRLAALRERRNPPAQAAILIREALVGRGLLSPDAPPAASLTQPQEPAYAGDGAD